MTDGVDEDDGDEDAGDEKLTTLASCRRCNQSASSPSRKQSVFHLMCFIFNDVLLYSCVDHHVEEDEDEEGQDLEENIGDAGNLIEYTYKYVNLYQIHIKYVRYIYMPGT